MKTGILLLVFIAVRCALSNELYVHQRDSIEDGHTYHVCEGEDLNIPWSYALAIPVNMVWTMEPSGNANSFQVAQQYYGKYGSYPLREKHQKSDVKVSSLLGFPGGIQITTISKDFQGTLRLEITDYLQGTRLANRGVRINIPVRCALSNELDVLQLDSIEDGHTYHVCEGGDLDIRWNYDLDIAVNMVWNMEPSGNANSFEVAEQFFNSYGSHPFQERHQKNDVNVSSLPGFAGGIQIIAISKDYHGTLSLDIIDNLQDTRLANRHVRISISDAFTQLDNIEDGDVYNVCGGEDLAIPWNFSVCSTRHNVIDWRLLKNNDQSIHLGQARSVGSIGHNYPDYSNIYRLHDTTGGILIRNISHKYTGTLSMTLMRSSSYFLGIKTSNHVVRIFVHGESRYNCLTFVDNLEEGHVIYTCPGEDVVIPWQLAEWSIAENQRLRHILKVKKPGENEFEIVLPQHNIEPVGRGGLRINNITPNQLGVYQLWVTPSNKDGELEERWDKQSVQVSVQRSGIGCITFTDNLEEGQVFTTCLGDDVVIPWQLDESSLGENQELRLMWLQKLPSDHDSWLEVAQRGFGDDEFFPVNIQPVGLGGIRIMDISLDELGVYRLQVTTRVMEGERIKQKSMLSVQVIVAISDSCED